MNFHEMNNSYDFFCGNSFSDAYKFYLGCDNPDIDRLSLISNICAERKIIHVGCVDHLSLLDHKIKNNTWLHSRLTRVAVKCIGIDINEYGIHMLCEKGIKSVYYHDLLTGGLEVFGDEPWDVMVLGEIIEHVDNPVLFLTTIKEKFKGMLSEVLLSVPNATSYDAICSLFKGYEFINSDHRYWFTPFTIAKVLALSGYTPISYQYCNSYPRRRFSPSSIFCKHFSFLRDTIVITAKL